MKLFTLVSTGLVMTLATSANAQEAAPSPNSNSTDTMKPATASASGPSTRPRNGTIISYETCILSPDIVLQGKDAECCFGCGNPFYFMGETMKGADGQAGEPCQQFLCQNKGYMSCIEGCAQKAKDAGTIGNATTAPETSDAIMPTGKLTDDALNVTTGARSPGDRNDAANRANQVQGIESPST